MFFVARSVCRAGRNCCSRWPFCQCASDGFKKLNHGERSPWLIGSKGEMQPSVLIIGGGLAGLAAAAALAPCGFRVTLLASRRRLGGRASSLIESVTREL